MGVRCGRYRANIVICDDMCMILDIIIQSYGYNILLFLHCFTHILDFLVNFIQSECKTKYLDKEPIKFILKSPRA